MTLLEAIIFRKLIKAYMPGLGNNNVDLCGSDALDILCEMLHSANETIKEAQNPVREMYAAAEDCITLMAEASAQGF